MIRFNKPFITGKEVTYMKEVIARGHLSGDGPYSKLCNQFFANTFGFRYNFLTTSGTDSLEMAAILMNVQSGDEIIMPSYTFVSTANAFALRGATVVFADSYPDHPNVDHQMIEPLITPRTKGIVVMHYGGAACNMDPIMQVANTHQLSVVEDAAQGVNARYLQQPLGSIGDYGILSFHETKNINCGEGGLLVVNNEQMVKRAEIVREKGTNRSAFFRGEIDKYSWVDIGSSFLSSELLAAFLYAQLEELNQMQFRRMEIWKTYNERLSAAENMGYQLPKIPSYAQHNAHIFYLVCPSLDKRSELIEFLSGQGIRAVFHYLPLHQSKYYGQLNGGRVPNLPNAVKFGDALVRLPLYPSLSVTEQELIIDKVLEFIKKN